MNEQKTERCIIIGIKFLDVATGNIIISGPKYRKRRFRKFLRWIWGGG